MNVTDGMHVNQLPSEMLLNIFAFLQPSELASSVCPVCQRWNDVAILHLKRLKFGPRGSTQDVLDVVEKSTLLESIDIHNRTDVDDILLEGVFNTCKLSHNKIQEMSVKLALQACSPGSILEGEVIGCQKRLCGGCLDCFPSSLGVATLSASCAEELIEYGRSLKRLELQNLKIKSRHFFDKIGTNLTSLKQLTIVECYNFTPSSLQLIAENCTELTEVTLLDNVKIRRYPAETSPEVQTAWNRAFEDLLEKRGPSLQVLEMDANLVLDSTLQALSKATRLQTLSLERADNLSTNGIAAISTLCNLTKLHIQYCDNLDEISVARMFAPGNLKSLESLAITLNESLTDECLDIISRYCPELEEVNLTESLSVTDLGVELIMARCRKLRLVNLYGMSSLRDSSLRLIPEMTPKRKLLVIYTYCDALKKKCIEDLMAGCPELEIQPDEFLSFAGDGLEIHEG